MRSSSPFSMMRAEGRSRASREVLVGGAQIAMA
jgi:hypothetical protein